MIYSIVYQGSEEICYKLEEFFRPLAGMGWNIIAGGARPNRTEAQKEAARKANTGRVRTAEEKHKVSIARKGVYVRGANSTAKKVRCLNTAEIFDCMKDAGEWCGLKNACSIGRVCAGKGDYAGRHPTTKEKLLWEFI